jgi:hypothetical protein
MLVDSIRMINGSTIENARVEMGTSFPVSPQTGRLFYLTVASGGNAVGLYVYDGTTWQTGDISKITAGSGLSGGGESGEITISLDSTVQTAIDDKMPLTGGIFDGNVSLTAEHKLSVPTPTGGFTAFTDVVNKGYLDDLESALTLDIDTKVAKSGDTMTGNLVMSADTTITLPTPTGGFPSAISAINKAYVDAVASGLVWLNPIIDPNLISDDLDTPPTPTDHELYIIGDAPTGAWAGLAGHVVYWDGSSWVDVLNRAVQVGDRFGVALETAVVPSGGLTSNGNKLAEITDATPGSIVYSFTDPLEHQAVFSNAANSYHFGHSYTFNGTNWIEFSGPTATGAGVGLSYTGNILNVNLGAGISQLPTDEVGVDVYTAGGLWTTEDGLVSSTDTNAQLGIKLNGSTLSLTTNGLALSSTGVTPGTYNSLTVDSYGRVTTATNESITLTGDATGTGTTNIAVTLADALLTTPGTYNNVTVNSKGLVTFGTNAASGGFSSYQLITTTYSASVSDAIIADTSAGAFTITLPAFPTTGDAIIIADGGNWVVNNLTIGRNGATIAGIADDLVLDVNSVQVTLIYDGTTWQVFTSSGAQELPSIAGNDGKVLSTDGINSFWETPKMPLVNDNLTNTTQYLTMSNTAVGDWTNAAYIASNKLYFNPSTGVLSSVDHNSLSDITLKDNVNSITNGLEIVKQINPVNFNWKDTGKLAHGVIAQEIEQILPEIIEDNDGIKSVSYIQLIAFLVDAVKTLSNEIEQLKGK